MLTRRTAAHQDRLYKYINVSLLLKLFLNTYPNTYSQWNDPVRTIGSYVGILSVLFGAHYLPLTQMALKGGVTALGCTYSRIYMVITEF